MLIKIETEGIPDIYYDTESKKFSGWADIVIDGIRKTVYFKEG